MLGLDGRAELVGVGRRETKPFAARALGQRLATAASSASCLRPTNGDESALFDEALGRGVTDSGSTTGGQGGLSFGLVAASPTRSSRCAHGKPRTQPRWQASSLSRALCIAGCRRTADSALWGATRSEVYCGWHGVKPPTVYPQRILGQGWKETCPEASNGCLSRTRSPRRRAIAPKRRSASASIASCCTGS